LGFVTGAVLRAEGISFISKHRLVDQASIFISPTDRVAQLYSWTLGIILVTSVTCMDHVGAVLFLATTWELH
jgi:hypothetical protein